MIGENAMDPTYLDFVRNPKNGYHSQRLQIGEKKEMTSKEAMNSLSCFIRAS